MDEQKHYLLTQEPSQNNRQNNQSKYMFPRTQVHAPHKMLYFMAMFLSVGCTIGGDIAGEHFADLIEKYHPTPKACTGYQWTGIAIGAIVGIILSYILFKIFSESHTKAAQRALMERLNNSEYKNESIRKKELKNITSILPQNCKSKKTEYYIVNKTAQNTFPNVQRSENFKSEKGKNLFEHLNLKVSTQGNKIEYTHQL
jgi:uncharacterized membrane-anchored protein YhcB (DUF1043 family)